jgi:sugar phosphate isomerase/epimerase
MRLGLSSLLFVNSTIEDCIRLSSELGAECVEVIYDVPHFPPGYDQRKLSRVKELLESFGLGVSVHASFWDLNPASHHRELWELSLNQVRRSIDACRSLGGDITVVHFGKCPIPEVREFLEGTKRRYREFLFHCLPYAQDRGVTLALENAGRDPHSYPPTIGELKQLVLELEGLKVTLDTGHAHLVERRAGERATGAAIAEYIRDLREHLVHLHVHDNRGRLDDHLPPGDGGINFRPVVEALREIGYDGFLIAELWNPQHPLETGRRGIEKLRKLFKTG